MHKLIQDWNWFRLSLGHVILCTFNYSSRIVKFESKIESKWHRNYGKFEDRYLFFRKIKMHKQIFKYWNNFILVLYSRVSIKWIIESLMFIQDQCRPFEQLLDSEYLFESWNECIHVPFMNAIKFWIILKSVRVFIWINIWTCPKAQKTFKLCTFQANLFEGYIWQQQQQQQTTPHINNWKLNIDRCSNI